MNDLQTAAQQALRALEMWVDETQSITQQDAITALRAALAQQAEPVEPVAWGVDWGRHGDRSCVSIIKKRADGTMEVVAVEYGPLYTAPPQRLPLTEEEIQAAWDSVDMRHPRGNETRIAFARAIERAHGIGEGA